MDQPLLQIDIDKIEFLATQVHNLGPHALSMDCLIEEQCREITRMVSNYVVIHGVGATHSLLDAIGIAINATNSEQMHDAFCMSLELKEDLQ